MMTRNMSFIRSMPWKRNAIAMLFAAFLQPVVAQEQRDPTAAPVEANPAVAGVAADANAAPAQGNSVIVRDGIPYLVVGTRLVAVGQRVGNRTLERITETEVWLREGRSLQKLQRFEGVVRHTRNSVAPHEGAKP